VKKLRDDLAELEFCTSVEGAAHWIDRFAGERGLPFFGYLGGGHATDYPGAVKLTNYPSSWVEEYCAEKLFTSDPLRLASLRSGVPFTWDEMAHMDRAQFRYAPKMLDLAQRHGLRSGFAIPLAVPGEQRAMITFAAPGKARELNRILENKGGELYTAALYFHMFILNFRRSKSKTNLTVRERTTLSLAVQGMPSRDIALALGVSVRTAKFHYNNARKKIGASNPHSSSDEGERLGPIIVTSKLRLEVTAINAA